MKKSLFKKGQFFHVFNKSIAKFNIFRTKSNSIRFLETLDYYNNPQNKIKLSVAKNTRSYKYTNLIYPRINSFFKFISYCIMPDHYHLLIKINFDDMLSIYINKIENSYTRFFNIKYKRKGPLWQSKFKFVQITTNEQLLHLSRYIHLNPSTANYVTRPEAWQFSSYKDFILDADLLTKYITEISIVNSDIYKRFVDNNLNYQRKLKLIRKKLIE